MEKWIDIKCYEGLYQISNYGNIKALKKWDVNLKKYTEYEKIMSSFDNGGGYLVVTLVKNKKRKNYYVHRLVATYFVENPLNKKYVNHLDYNRYNNNASNLEWCTQKENMLYSSKRLSHPKSFTKTNTGEMYITYRKSRNRYRVIIDKKEIGTYKTLEEAIKVRNDAIKKR